MANDYHWSKRASQTEKEAWAVNGPLSIPSSPPTQLWVELAEEAERYSLLLEMFIISSHEMEPKELEKYEQMLLNSLAHIQMHSQVLNEGVLNALELADDLEARGLINSG